MRYDTYSELDDSEVTWQVGFDFSPIQSLKFRGTAGTVFRAPTITDLYAGRQDNFPFYTDPCAGGPGDEVAPYCAQLSSQPDAQVLTVVSGNPELSAETGDTFTVGMVWTPDFGLTATVDYWQISLDDAISSYGAQDILDGCYFNNDPYLCGQITRDANYEVIRIVDDTLNLAEQGAKGIDAELRYLWATDVGDFEFGIVWSHLLERTKTPFKGAPEEDLSGRFTDPTAQDGGGYPTDKGNFQAQWQWQGVTLTYLAEYIGSIDADTLVYGTQLHTADRFAGLP